MSKRSLIRKLARAAGAMRERDEALRALYAEPHRLKLRELSVLSGLTVSRVSQICSKSDERFGVPRRD